MKKIIYMIAFVLVTSFVFSACTKEEVKPSGTVAPMGTGNRE